MRERILLGDLSTQDADLLGRLTLYFDTLEDRLRQGQGWLIFNSGSDRGARIVAFILGRLNEYRPYFSYYHLPWRDFALHAYVSTVELPKDATLLEQDGEDSPRRRERTIATSVATATSFHLAHADIVVLSNIHPSQFHEALVLSETATERTTRRRATIALTPHDPWTLASAFAGADPSSTTWRRFYDAMHQTSLVAV